MSALTQPGANSGSLDGMANESTVKNNLEGLAHANWSHHMSQQKKVDLSKLVMVPSPRTVRQTKVFEMLSKTLLNNAKSSIEAAKVQEKPQSPLDKIPSLPPAKPVVATQETT